MIVRSQVFETCASTNSATCPSAGPPRLRSGRTNRRPSRGTRAGPLRPSKTVPALTTKVIARAYNSRGCDGGNSTKFTVWRGREGPGVRLHEPASDLFSRPQTAVSLQYAGFFSSPSPPVVEEQYGARLKRSQVPRRNLLFRGFQPVSAIGPVHQGIAAL